MNTIRILNVRQSHTYLLLAFIIGVVCVSYFYQAVPDCLHNRSACFGRGDLAPFRYRVLPIIVEEIFVSNASQETVLLFDFLLQSVLTTAVFVGLFRWLQRMNRSEYALIGCVLLALFMIESYHFYLRSIGTTLELMAVVYALLLLSHSFKRAGFIAIAMLVILASLNRETGLIIPLLYIAHFLKEWRSQWKHFLLLIFCWGIIQASIHLTLGPAPHVLGLAGTFIYNLDNLPDAIFANAIFIPVILLLLMNYRKARPLFKRLLWAAGLYLLAVLVGGAWGETQRLLLPVVPLVLPILCDYAAGMSSFESITRTHPDRKSVSQESSLD